MPAQYRGSSVPLSLTWRAHVRIKSVYIAEIPTIRITGSSRNFASRRRVFGVSCLVAINFGVCTLRRPATRAHTRAFNANAAPCWCGRYEGTARATRHKFSALAATRTYLRCPPRVLIIPLISISAGNPRRSIRFSPFCPAPPICRARSADYKEESTREAERKRGE